MLFIRKVKLMVRCVECLILHQRESHGGVSHCQVFSFLPLPPATEVSRRFGTRTFLIVADGNYSKFFGNTRRPRENSRVDAGLSARMRVIYQ
jgi:hypothetical protein